MTKLKVRGTVHIYFAFILLRKIDPTGLPVLLQLHFYKLDNHIYLKPKNNTLFPSTAYLAIQLSANPMPAYNAGRILVSDL